MFHGSRDSHAKYFSTPSIGLGVISPQEGGTPFLWPARNAFSKNDHTIELLSFSFVYRHNMDAGEILRGFKDRILRKSRVERVTCSRISAFFEPKSCEVRREKSSPAKGHQIVEMAG